MYTVDASLMKAQSMETAQQKFVSYVNGNF
jgi:hypothetical protein